MSFTKILGQDIAIKALKNIIAKNQARGTYLFLGPDGVGKRTAGIEFAKAINCERDLNDISCDCVSCSKIESGNHPDVFCVFPEGPSSSIKIEKIRDIIYQASLKPYEARKRIFIINEAETATIEAQNAFLKLLEEPPENHIMILTASSLAGLLSTVLSRCKILRFNLLPSDQIREFLKGELTCEIEEEEAVLFSHMAMGSIGRALSFKENDLISRRNQVVNDFFFRKSALLREDVLKKQIDEDIEETLYILLCWYRDLFVSKFTQEESEILNIDRFSEISSYSSRFTKDKLEKDLFSIMKTIEYTRRNVNPKIALFNLAVELKRG